MMKLWKRLGVLTLTGALALGLALPALAAEGDTAAGPQAIQAAMEYSGAVSIQYALWEDGAVTETGGAGVYSRSENRALTADILYGVGSVSKIYTTVAVL